MKRKVFFLLLWVATLFVAVPASAQIKKSPSKKTTDPIGRSLATGVLEQMILYSQVALGLEQDEEKDKYDWVSLSNYMAWGGNFSSRKAFSFTNGKGVIGTLSIPEGTDDDLPGFLPNIDGLSVSVSGEATAENVKKCVVEIGQELKFGSVIGLKHTKIDGRMSKGVPSTQPKNWKRSFGSREEQITFVAEEALTKTYKGQQIGIYLYPLDPFWKKLVKQNGDIKIICSPHVGRVWLADFSVLRLEDITGLDESAKEYIQHKLNIPSFWVGTVFDHIFANPPVIEGGYTGWEIGGNFGLEWKRSKGFMRPYASVSFNPSITTYRHWRVELQVKSLSLLGELTLGTNF